MMTKPMNTAIYMGEFLPSRTIAAARASNRLLISAMLTLFALLVYSMPSHSTQGVDAGGDTGAAEIMPIAMLQFHAIDFNRFLRDYQLPIESGSQGLPYYLTNINGKIVSFYPIIPGLLNLPVFWVAKHFGIGLFEHRYQLSAITSALMAALSVGAMFRALAYVCRRQQVAVLFSLVYAFATTAWSVCSRTLWQHGPAMLFLSVSLALILSRHRRWIAYSGFFLMMAVWTRPTVAVIVAPIAIFILVNVRRAAIPFLLAALLPAVCMMAYSHYYCGSVMSLGQGRSIVQDTTGSNPTYGAGWHGLAGILVSPARGLFVFTPVFIFSFMFLLRCSWSKEINRLYPFLGLSVILYVALYSQWKVWWGGYCFGYRLLCEIVPILVLFLAEAWQRWFAGRTMRTAVFVSLLAVSVYFQFLGATYYPTNFNNVPQSVNTHPDRLWNLRDTELVRCQQSFLGAH